MLNYFLTNKLRFHPNIKSLSTVTDLYQNKSDYGIYGSSRNMNLSSVLKAYFEISCKEAP